MLCRRIHLYTVIGRLPLLSANTQCGMPVSLLSPILDHTIGIGTELELGYYVLDELNFGVSSCANVSR